MEPEEGAYRDLNLQTLVRLMETVHPSESLYYLIPNAVLRSLSPEVRKAVLGSARIGG